MTEIKKIYSYVLIIFGFFLMPETSVASSIFFETTEPLYSVGSPGSVEVYLDTEGQTVNTVSGSIRVDAIRGPLIDIFDGNSSLLFWIDRPKWSDETNHILFSGITPGGFSGDRIFLFSFDITPVDANPIGLSFDDTSVLLHDGEGTLLETESTPKTLFVSTNSRNPLRNIPDDREPPEDFVPIITKDENLYDGNFVAVFATQDKGSGILMYQIREGILGRFKQVESPYVLRNQNRMNMLVVRAIDRSGNIRSVVVHPQGNIMGEYGILLIVGILVVLVVLFIRKKKQRSSL